MGLKSTKQKIKDFIDVGLIDVQGQINTQGNYIHFSGSTKVSPLKTKFQFTLTIAGASLTGNEGSIEETLEKVLIDICKYELKNGIDLAVKSEIIKLEGELLAYKIVLSIEDDTI